MDTLIRQPLSPQTILRLSYCIAPANICLAQVKLNENKFHGIDADIFFYFPITLSDCLKRIFFPERSINGCMNLNDDGQCHRRVGNRIRVLKKSHSAVLILCGY